MKIFSLLFVLIFIICYISFLIYLLLPGFFQSKIYEFKLYFGIKNYKCDSLEQRINNFKRTNIICENEKQYKEVINYFKHILRVDIERFLIKNNFKYWFEHFPYLSFGENESYLSFGKNELKANNFFEFKNKITYQQFLKMSQRKIYVPKWKKVWE